MDPNDDNTDGTGMRYTRDERIQMALKILRDGRISLLDFILHVLRSSKGEFRPYQARFFKNQSGRLTELLDRLFEDKRGRPTFLSWMEPRAIGFISDKVAKEMGDVKAALAWTINATAPENLLTWGIDAFIGPVVDSNAPILGHLLRVAAETKRAGENNKFKSRATVWHVFAV